MRISQKFYLTAKEYQYNRQNVNREYSEYMESMKRYPLKQYEGSDYYRELGEKAKAKRDAAIKAAQETYTTKLSAIIDEMRRNNANRPIKAPTQEQLSILTALKMRDRLSDEEIKRAANAMRDCPVAFDVVNEIARKNGVFLPALDGRSVSIGNADEIINQLQTATNDFVGSEYDRFTRHINEHRFNMYGGSSPMAERQLFDNAEDCFYQLTNLKGDSLKAFCDAVDGVEDADDENG